MARLIVEPLAFMPLPRIGPPIGVGLRIVPSHAGRLIVETLALMPLPRIGPSIGVGLRIVPSRGAWSNGSARMPKPDDTATVSSGRRIDGGVAASPLASQNCSTPSDGRKRWMVSVPLALVTSSAHRTRATPIGMPSPVNVCS
jgi:hypothetical protein